MKQREIVDVLGEIRFIKELAAVGPIYGDHLGIAPMGSQVSVSMMHLIERAREQYSDHPEVVEGIDLAVDVFLNPRNFMTEDEQKSYDLLVEKEKQEDARAERYRAPVVPPTTAKRGISKPGKRGPGRPKKSNPADHVPTVTVKLNIVDGKAKFS
jgi:hypothetical protein